MENTVLGFGVRNSALQESGILEMIGIRNPSSADKEFEIRYLKSEIHSVESRIQDSLGLPFDLFFILCLW